MKKRWTIADIKAADKAAGRYFFSAATRRFWQSRIESKVYQGRGGIYFVTSEVFLSGMRIWHVRQFTEKPVYIHTAAEFSNLAGARREAQRLAEKEAE